jgi:outer membrane protein assembly complex protein YaeT
MAIVPLRRWRHGLAALAVAVCAACREGTGIDVSDFQIAGTKALKVSDILKVLATKADSWIPWAPKRDFDRGEFETDLKRIQAYYADHGYPNAKVTDVDIGLNDTNTSVKLRVTVDEGTPVVVDEVRFEGFDLLTDNARNSLNDVPLKAGSVRDYDTVKATRDQATALFHNGGYPKAFVDASERPAAAGHVIVSFRADAGPKMTFGPVEINGLQSVDENVVRRQFAFRPDATFRESQVVRTQHSLQTLEVFQVVNVAAYPDEAKDDNRVPLRVTLAEGKPRQVKLGVGFGSEEHVRGTVDWRHVNFFGGARQGELYAKYSAIDRGVRLTFEQPYVGKPGLSLSFQGLAWQTSQLTYDEHQYGGRVTLSYTRERRFGPGRSPVQWSFHLAYVNEFLEYGIKPDALDDQSSREERIALGLDPVTGRGKGTLGAIDFDVARTVVDNTVDPHQGFLVDLHLQHAAHWLLGTYGFNEVLGDVRRYQRLGSSVIAGRLRIGSIDPIGDQTFPFSSLYFLGGSTSLRGWGRFEVSPIDSNGFPIGGRTTVEGSVEVRQPVTPRLAIVWFLDSGDVTEGSWDLKHVKPKTDIGAGLRYTSPIGVIRFDYGHQVNHIAGLVINGNPETRYWRIHFSIGQAF